MKLKQMQDRCTELEEEVARLETGIAECEQSLSSFHSLEETLETQARLETHRNDLQARLSEWEEISQAIETAQA